MTVTLPELATALQSRGSVAFAAALSVGASLAALALPWFVGSGVMELVDEGISGLHVTLVVVVALLAVRLVLEFASTLVAGRARYQFICDLRAQWYDRALGIPPGTEGEARRQEWVSVLSYDIPRVAEVVVDIPVSLVQAVVTLLGAAAVMVSINAPLTGLVLCVAPVAYFGARLAVRSMRSRAVKYWDLEIGLMSDADESLRARWPIQAFLQHERFRQQFVQRAGATRDAGLEHLRLLAFVGPATQFVAFSGMAAIVALASAGVGGPLSAGELLAFVLYGLLLSQPLRAVADSWSVWHEASATLGRFEDIASLVVESTGGELGFDGELGELQIEDVSFAWRGPRLLDGASLTIRAGECVALTGDNGAGKTTLLALLLGFARPLSGRLAVDGVALDDLTLAARRGLFAVVPQHAALFGGTVRDNVAFARPEAGDVQIREALQSAQATEFVAALPRGLDTRIGEDGLHLSGGERQRLAIARAMLLGAPVLVLDEATSGFDYESALAFREAVRSSGKTVLWITHDSSIESVADRVVRLEGGRFIERLNPARVVG